MKRIAAILTASAAIFSACDAPPVSQDEPAASSSVVYTAMQLRGGTDDAPANSTSCRVVFPVTYPADVTPHRREVEIRQINASVSQGFTSVGPVSLPYPPEHPNAKRNPDGTVTWRGAAFTFGPCRPTSWIVTIGRCLSGDCPPMTFARSGQMGDIAVELRRTE